MKKINIIKVLIVVLFYMFITLTSAADNGIEREIRIQDFQADFLDSFGSDDETLVDPTRAPSTSDGNIAYNQLKVISVNEDQGNKIEPGDQLFISFEDRGERNNAIYKVNGEGLIRLPLIGPLKVEQLTASEVRDIVQNKLTQFIRTPDVKVTINATGRFMVLGAVSRPGLYSLRSRFTAMEGLLQARYQPNRAKLRNILIMRGTQDKPKVIKIDLDKMVRFGDRTDNLDLKPGDLVLVPTRTISNVSDYIHQVYRWIFMWYGLGGQDIIEEGDPFIDAIEF